MQYRVILEGGSNVVVVPAWDRDPVTELLPVLLYRIRDAKWFGWQHLG